MAVQYKLVDNTFHVRIDVDVTDIALKVDSGAGLTVEQTQAMLIRVRDLLTDQFSIVGRTDEDLATEKAKLIAELDRKREDRPVESDDAVAVIKG